jgi:ATPase family AAA domain-containing protein 3A/B
VFGSRAQAEVDKEKEKTKQREKAVELRKVQEEEETKRRKVLQEERTKQLEVESKTKKMLEETRTAEQKKLTDYRLKQELEQQREKTRLKLKAKEEFDRLDENKRQREEEQAKLRAKLEKNAKDAEYARQERLLRAKLELKAKLERENELKLAEHRHEEALRMHEATKEFTMEKELQMQRLRVEADVRKEREKWEQLGNFFVGDQGKERLWNIGGLVVGLVATVYAFRVAYPLATQALRRYFFKPQLISRNVKYSPVVKKITHQRPRPKVIFSKALQSRVDRVVEGTRNTGKRGGFYGNLMLYGSPGTGKTLFAERLAAESHMDFAMMSGPAFDQFQPHEAIVEIKELFKWANRAGHAGRNGLLLFVDEADCFLEDRATLHPSRVSVLNEWINQTGTESSHFMCVYETNRPEVLDPAVQSRVATSINVPPPGKRELRKLLEQYIRLYLLETEMRDNRPWYRRMLRPPPVLKAPLLEKPSFLDDLSERLANEGFVGRDVTNLVIAWLQCAYASDSFVVSDSMVESIIEEQLHKRQTEAKYLSERRARIKDHLIKMQR